MTTSIERIDIDGRSPIHVQRNPAGRVLAVGCNALARGQPIATVDRLAREYGLTSGPMVRDYIDRGAARTLGWTMAYLWEAED